MSLERHDGNDSSSELVQNPDGLDGVRQLNQARTFLMSISALAIATTLAIAKACSDEPDNKKQVEPASLVDKDDKK